MFAEPPSLYASCRYADQTRQTASAPVLGSSVEWSEGAGKVILVLPSAEVEADELASGGDVDELHLQLCTDSGEVVATRTLVLSKILGEGLQWQSLTPTGALLVDVSPPRQL
jgi:hypothetical protein